VNFVVEEKVFLKICTYEHVHIIKKCNFFNPLSAKPLSEKFVFGLPKF